MPSDILLELFPNGYLDYYIMEASVVVWSSVGIVFPLATRGLILGGGVFVKLHTSTCQDTLHNNNTIYFFKPQRRKHVYYLHNFVIKSVQRFSVSLKPIFKNSMFTVIK